MPGTVNSHHHLFLLFKQEEAGPLPNRGSSWVKWIQVQEGQPRGPSPV